MPSFGISAAPIVLLLVSLAAVVAFVGADAISVLSPWALLTAAMLAVLLAACSGSLSRRGMKLGFCRNSTQIMPAVPMLVFIAMVSTTWMLSGVVPTLIDYGLRILNPTFFLVTACAVCAVISVLTGSSWSTIATVGVALMGIGTVMGFHPGWVAGAIISGAYFGDKVSPLSDTTVVASSACGVDLFEHIRYLMFTAIPAMVMALVVFFVAGAGHGDIGHTRQARGQFQYLSVDFAHSGYYAHDDCYACVDAFHAFREFDDGSCGYFYISARSDGDVARRAVGR